MFKDNQEELARLEQALLEEEEELYEDDLLEEEDLYEDDLPEETPCRDYTGRYKIYNADNCDGDLEEYSDRVYEGRSGVSGLTITALLLSCGILGVMVWILLRYWI